jgi:hypothetical protein
VDYLVAENKKSEGIIKPLRGRLPVAPMVLIDSRFASRPEIHTPSVNGGYGMAAIGIHAWEHWEHWEHWGQWDLMAANDNRVLLEFLK